MNRRSGQRRAEQLRKAKRAQRARERARGLEHVQLTLPARAAAKLRIAMREQAFGADLERFLDEAVVRIADHPALREVAWNLDVEYLPARYAFSLYERNWRLVEGRLSSDERALVDRLADRFGGGIIHA